jgi:hypothetical protein
MAHNGNESTTADDVGVRFSGGRYLSDKYIIAATWMQCERACSDSRTLMDTNVRVDKRAETTKSAYNELADLLRCNNSAMKYPITPATTVPKQIKATAWGSAAAKSGNQM